MMDGDNDNLAIYICLGVSIAYGILFLIQILI